MLNNCSGNSLEWRQRVSTETQPWGAHNTLPRVVLLVYNALTFYGYRKLTYACIFRQSNSGYYSNELSSDKGMHELLHSVSRKSELSSVSVYRVYSESTYIILMWMRWRYTSASTCDVKVWKFMWYLFVVYLSMLLVTQNIYCRMMWWGKGGLVELKGQFGLCTVEPNSMTMPEIVTLIPW